MNCGYILKVIIFTKYSLPCFSCTLMIIFFFLLMLMYLLLAKLQIWTLVQVQVCFRCTDAKLFTWLVPTLILDLHTFCCKFEAAIFLWFEGHSRFSYFLDFSLKSSHCGLTNPCIQVRHGQGIHNVEGAKNYKKLMKPEYFDAHLTPLGWQQVGRRH